MVTGVACGLQNRYGAFVRPGWVRFPHVPATRARRLVAAGFLVWLAGFAAGLRAQETPPDTARAAETEVARDTLPPVSPLGALARSMVLPGWGQVAVGRPSRGAIYFAAEAGSLFMVFKTQAKLSAARRADPPDEDLIEARTGQRENWIVLSVFIAFLSGLDAWVSANFWDFEPRIEAPADGSPGLAVSFAVSVP